MNSHNAFSCIKHEIKHSQKETFTKKPAKSKSTNAFDKSRRRVTSKKSLFIFSFKSKRERETGTFGPKKNKNKSTNKYDKKKRQITTRRYLSGFNKSEKRERNKSGFRTKEKSTKDFYAYNSKKKRLTLKRRTMRQNGVFTEKTEKHSKNKKKSEPELFDPKMHIHFKRL
jgi:hypothetical protein